MRFLSIVVLSLFWFGICGAEPQNKFFSPEEIAIATERGHRLAASRGINIRIEETTDNKEGFGATRWRDKTCRVKLFPYYSVEYDPYFLNMPSAEMGLLATMFVVHEIGHCIEDNPGPRDPLTLKRELHADLLAGLVVLQDGESGKRVFERFVSWRQRTSAAETDHATGKWLIRVLDESYIGADLVNMARLLRDRYMLDVDPFELMQRRTKRRVQ